MADVKISQLPQASLPLSGTEIFPLVQNGVTVQAPVGSIKEVSTIDNLRVVPPIDNVGVYVEGYYASGDGGGGNFIGVSGGSYTDNGGTVITTGLGVTASSAWIRVYSGAVNVKWFGARGDDSTDDKIAIQASFDNGESVYFPDGNYVIGSTITVLTTGVTISGTGVIKPTASFIPTVVAASSCLMSIQASNVTLSGLTIDGVNRVAPAVTPTNFINFFVWVTGALYVKIENCTFLNMPWGYQPEAVIGYNQPSPYATVVNNYFNTVPGAIFVQSRSAIISGNTIINPKDVGIVLHSLSNTGSIVSANIVRNEALTSLSSCISVEEGASNWIIESNNIYGIRGVGIFAASIVITTLVTGGIIRNNYIDGAGGTGTGVVTGIAYSQYYKNVSIIGNSIVNFPTSGITGAGITAACTGGYISNNIVDLTGATLAQAVALTAGGDNLTLESNEITVTTGRQVLFVVGDYSSNIVTFTGGSFYGGTTGIDASNAGVLNLEIWVENISKYTGTNFVNFNAGIGWGSRITYINSQGALAWPHSIKGRTVMYGSAVPSSGNWDTGDTIYNNNPRPAIPEAGWVYSFDGAVFSWRKLADTV